jgi:hypothetical protein
MSTFDGSRSSHVATAIDDPNGKNALYQRFFQRLIDDLRENHNFTNAHAGGPRNWQSFGSGTSGLTYAVAFPAGGRVRAEIYIDSGERVQKVAAFEALRTEESALKQEFRALRLRSAIQCSTSVDGETLEWELLEGRRACRIAVYRSGTIEDSTRDLEQYHQWAVDCLLRLKAVFGPRLPSSH